ncbi:dTDP-4-dehydrorhamnose 3,5-epimerase [Aquimarina pacifica]|uniref:dTDP-4-dehydrorhamnose 3,5-epimerase n=1 Tax=Aquimarina pacifica TaxID=1296415 RepID=UPI00046FC6C6|nr:dTDP-4-dehydrorhamnose 3,5-epimerase [Aquimarina pacifica]
MQVEKTFLSGCFIVKPRVIKDERGSFFESFNQKVFEELTGLKIDFIQDNQSISKRGVIRGLHFQKGDFAQAKLVRAIQGEILDIAVDLREDSPTYGKHFSIRLNDQNNFQLFIPRGFAHGFAVLSETAIFGYKCDNYYDKSSESGIMYNDPNLAIDWELDLSEIQLSEKDKGLPRISDFRTINF